MISVWYANDNRLIGWPTYTWPTSLVYAGPIAPDTRRLWHGPGGFDHRLQDVVTWLINARVTDEKES